MHGVGVGISVNRSHIVVFSFLALLLTFGIVRAQNEYRWSGWATGDAQSINAALHFAREGFLGHYFLPNYHPGYLGMPFGSASSIGYYTHYPQLSSVIQGLGAIFFGDSLLGFRALSISFAIGGLVAWYALACTIVPVHIAAASTIVMGTSVGFLDFMDSQSGYCYDELFTFNAMLAFVLSEKSARDGRLARRKCLLGIAWIFALLQSLNGYDYIIFIQVFAFVYHWRTSDKGVAWATVAFLVTAPVCGFALHLVQNALAYGGLKSAIQDLGTIFIGKTINVQEGLYAFIKQYLTLAKNINYWLFMQTGISLGLITVMIAFGSVISWKTASERSIWPGGLEEITPLTMVVILGLCGTLWWLIMPRAVMYFGMYAVRHVLPALSILIGFMVWWCVERLQDPLHENKLAIVIGLAGIVIGPILNTGVYLSKYPNPIEPMRTWGWESATTTTSEIADLIQTSKALRDHTSHGDVVLVPSEFLWRKQIGQVNPLFEYYAQRRLIFQGTLGDDTDHVVSLVTTYKRQVEDRYAEATVHLYALVPDSNACAWERRWSQNKSYDLILNGRWRLYRLD